MKCRVSPSSKESQLQEWERTHVTVVFINSCTHNETGSAPHNIYPLACYSFIVTADFIHKISWWKSYPRLHMTEMEKLWKWIALSVSESNISTERYWYIAYNMYSIASHPPSISIFLFAVLMLRDVKKSSLFLHCVRHICVMAFSEGGILRMRKSFILHAFK